MITVVYASSGIAPPGQGHLQGIVGQLDRWVGPYGPNPQSASTICLS